MDGRLERVLAEFAALVRRVGRRYRLSDADLEDVLQEVRIRLWRAGEKEIAVSASYVYRTSMSAAIDLIRRRRARGGGRTVTLEQAPEPVAPAQDPSIAIEEQQLAALVARAIEGITPSRRAVVRMVLAGHSREEVAELMGWSEAKTRNLLYRGLGEMRERLAEWGVAWKSTA